ncbi:MAG: nicotinate-nucleotide adenylyltransferase [Acidiferrobacteraceae bacterium]
MRPIVGIFGGTFDPVHYGHLRTVAETASALMLEQVVVVPCGTPYHRDAPVASPRERLDMVRLAVQENPIFAVDDREVASGSPCYSVVTLSALRRERSDRTFCLIIGRDSFLTITQWYEWPRLFELGHVVVMSRLDADGDPDPELWRYARRLLSPGELSERRSGGVLEHAVSPQSLSASEVRRAAADGRPLDDMVPPGVAGYINAHHLYL